jgi:hypothetical protein
MRRERLAGRVDGDDGSEIDRVAVRAGRDRGEGDGAAAEPGRELDRAPMYRREQLGLAVIPAAPDRADRVDHVSRRKVAGARCLGVAGVAAAESPALREDRRPARAVDRAVDAASPEQRRIRRVDDRVHFLLGDVTDLEPNPAGHGE